MKKILVCLILMILFNAVSAIAIEPEKDKTIKLIYVNGSNSNDDKGKLAYLKGFHSLHKQIKDVFENDVFMKEHLLTDNYTIDPDEEILFWGFQSKKDLDVIKDDLELAKKISPSISQHIRSLLAHCMHDAIWIQKPYNMRKVIDQMHKMVMKAHNNGQKVILLGHSAGSFVTYEYLLHKIKAGNIKFLTGKNEYTCLDALIKSKMAYKLANGKIEKNPNEKLFNAAYKKLDEYTKCQCIPDDTVLGVINFGSPLSLFYSSQISGSRENSSAYQLYFLKYMQSHDMFFLTVNFADDPIGFPVGNNISKNDIEMEFNTTLDENGKGFVYNYSKVRSRITPAGAHFAYWKLPRRFAKAIKEAYKKGYNNFYEIYKDKE